MAVDAAVAVLGLVPASLVKRILMAKGIDADRAGKLAMKRKARQTASVTRKFMEVSAAYDKQVHTCWTSTSRCGHGTFTGQAGRDPPGIHRQGSDAVVVWERSVDWFQDPDHSQIHTCSSGTTRCRCDDEVFEIAKRVSSVHGRALYDAFKLECPDLAKELSRTLFMQLRRMIVPRCQTVRVAQNYIVGVTGMSAGCIRRQRHRRACGCGRRLTLPLACCTCCSTRSAELPIRGRADNGACCGLSWAEDPV